MKIPPEMNGARLNVARTAELVSMDPAHFRRLVRRGVFPTPKRTAKGMPFFDHELLCRIGEVLKSGIGLSGEEISFYRRKPKRHRPHPPRTRGRQAQSVDPYLESIIGGCRQLGIGDELLDPATVKRILVAECGDERPDLEQAIPVVARSLLGGQG